MSFYFVPQTSPDDVTNQIEGLTVTGKYKRTWVELRQVEAQDYCPMKPNFSSLLIRKPNLHFSPGQFQRSFDKKAPPVSMSKLLSHGYVEDKKKSPNDDDCSSTIIVSLPERSCVTCSKATAVCVSLRVTWRSRCFPRCDLGPDEHQCHWGRGRPGVVAGASPLPRRRFVVSQTHKTRHGAAVAPLRFTRICCTSTDCFVLMFMQKVLSSYLFALICDRELIWVERVGARCALGFSVFCSIWKTSRWQVGRRKRRRLGPRRRRLGVRFLPWLYEDRVSEFLTCLCSRRVVPVMWNVLLSDGMLMFAAAGVFNDRRRSCATSWSLHWV